MKILFPLLFLCTIGYSQTTYTSLASEYIFKELPYSTAEFMERDIIIGSRFIILKSYGKNGTDIQKWRIQSTVENIDTVSSNTVYYVDLASGDEYEYPASFTIQFDSEGKAETITFVVPPSAQDRLSKKAPISVRFIIN